MVWGLRGEEGEEGVAVLLPPFGMLPSLPHVLPGQIVLSGAHSGGCPQRPQTRQGGGDCRFMIDRDLGVAAQPKLGRQGSSCHHLMGPVTNRTGVLGEFPICPCPPAGPEGRAVSAAGRGEHRGLGTHRTGLCPLQFFGGSGGPEQGGGRWEMSAEVGLFRPHREMLSSAPLTKGFRDH